jgi:hypothetical protein
MLKRLWQFLLKLNDLSEQTGWDKLIHTAFCFGAVYFYQATILATIVVSLMIEFEQWNNGIRKLRRSSEGYFLNKVLPDLIADAAGILLAVVIQFWN